MVNDSKAAQRKSLKQKAYEIIRTKILDCEYAPNERLNEQILCDQLGSISRTPVRDAIGRLEQEELVRILPKKGILVAPIEPREIDLIYELRMLLEPYALLHCGERISPDVLLKFQHMLNDASNTSRAQQNRHYFYDTDNQFHRLIIDATENRYIIRAFENTQSTNHRIRILSGDEIATRVPESFREHERIISACLHQDWEGAARSMTTHLEHARAAAFAILKAGTAR